MENAIDQEKYVSFMYYADHLCRDIVHRQYLMEVLKLNSTEWIKQGIFQLSYLKPVLDWGVCQHRHFWICLCNIKTYQARTLIFVVCFSVISRQYPSPKHGPVSPKNLLLACKPDFLVEEWLCIQFSAKSVKRVPCLPLPCWDCPC